MRACVPLVTPPIAAAATDVFTLLLLLLFSLISKPFQCVVAAVAIATYGWLARRLLVCH